MPSSSFFLSCRFSLCGNGFSPALEVATVLSAILSSTRFSHLHVHIAGSHSKYMVSLGGNVLNVVSGTLFYMAYGAVLHVFPLLARVLTHVCAVGRHDMACLLLGLPQLKQQE